MTPKQKAISAKHFTFLSAMVTATRPKRKQSKEVEKDKEQENAN